MDESFDVVVVGARCAGTVLAHHLARAGARVAVLDRAALPGGEVISTHVFQNSAVRSLERLGVLDRVRAAGAPPLTACVAPMDDGIDMSTPIPTDAEGYEMAMCVRRSTLDPILLDAAREAGADVRTSWRVTSLLFNGSRVGGVEAADADGRCRRLQARLVVGADGRLSTVARLVGARRYHVIPNRRFYRYAYYEAGPLPDPVPIAFQRRRDELGFVSPTDGGLLVVTISPDFQHLPAWMREPERCFDEAARGMEAFEELLSGARRVSRITSLNRAPGFFREAAGPGWALAGDAGHFKDPTPGQGIADAFQHAEWLAATVVAGLGGARDLDAGLRDYWRRRDRECFERHWWARDTAQPGHLSPVTREVLRELSSTPEGRMRFWSVFLRLLKPRELLRPAMAASAAVRLLGRHRRSRPLAVVLDAARLAVEEAQRTVAFRRPRFEERAVGPGIVLDGSPPR